MNKFKIELTWHNCKTYPPKETYNPFLIITNGSKTTCCSYHKNYGFPVEDEELHKYWWADISRTVSESNEFKEIYNE